MPGPADLPLILRDEPFGGIAFNPADGTLVELDPAAFALVQDLVKGRREWDGAEAREVADRLTPLLGLESARRPARIVTGGQSFTPDFGFQVFSVPTLVDFQITHCCHMNCPHCYASSTPEGAHAAMPDVERVIEQAAACGVCQIALGGGEPLLHPHLESILALCCRSGLVPNLSTNGMHLDHAQLKWLRRYCGAVALSLEGVGTGFARWRRSGFDHLQRGMAALRAAGVPTVLQVTLSTMNFADLAEITEFCLAHPHLYGVIFLAYKPVGRGRVFAQPLSCLVPRMVCDGLRGASVRLASVMRVGYDCCLTPAVAGLNRDLVLVDETHLEGCSALRGSVGITPELDAVPCTFLPDQALGNLRQQGLREIWCGSRAQAFRQRIAERSVARAACRACLRQAQCLGGCPVMDLVNCETERAAAVPVAAAWGTEVRLPS